MVDNVAPGWSIDIHVGYYQATEYLYFVDQAGKAVLKNLASGASDALWILLAVAAVGLIAWKLKWANNQLQNKLSYEDLGEAESLDQSDKTW